MPLRLPQEVRIGVSSFAAQRQSVSKPAIRSFGQCRSKLVMMPEGPEVRALVDQLQPAIGCRLVDLHFMSGRYTFDKPTGWSEFRSSMTPLTKHQKEDTIAAATDRISDWKCKGKFMYILLDPGSKAPDPLDDDWQRSIWITLGMTGRFVSQSVYDRSDPQKQSHARWYMELLDPTRQKNHRIYYQDQRSFGTLRFSLSRQDLISKLQSLGPDVLDLASTTPQDFLNICQQQPPEKNICKLLMDQSNLSGVGNYMLAEALYRASIDPYASLEAIDPKQQEELFQEIQAVAKESYQSQTPLASTTVQENGDQTPSVFEFQCYGRETCVKGNTVYKDLNGPHGRTIWYTARQLFRPLQERNQVRLFHMYSSSGEDSPPLPSSRLNKRSYRSEELQPMSTKSLISTEPSPTTSDQQNRSKMSKKSLTSTEPSPTTSDQRNRSKMSTKSLISIEPSPTTSDQRNRSKMFTKSRISTEPSATRSDQQNRSKMSTKSRISIEPSSTTSDQQNHSKMSTKSRISTEPSPTTSDQQNRSKSSKDSRKSPKAAAAAFSKGIIEETWRHALRDCLETKWFADLAGFVYKERDRGAKIYPPTNEQVFGALNACPIGKVKVVILGQDPYHGPGQAHGLAFSVNREVRLLPPSLRNIFRELEEEGFMMYNDGGTAQHGNLQKWADQGVLLLNTVLTVRQGEANSHAGRGWEEFTDAVIRALTANHEREGRSLVFLLWGNPAAQKATGVIDPDKHIIIRCSHPSPLSASRTNTPFLGSGCFQKANQALQEMNQDPIDWILN